MNWLFRLKNDMNTRIHERIIMVWVLPEVLVVSMKGIDKSHTKSHGKSLAWRLAFVTLAIFMNKNHGLPDDLLLLHTYTCHIHEWNWQESLLRFLPEDSYSWMKLTRILTCHSTSYQDTLLLLVDTCVRPCKSFLIGLLKNS